MLSSFIGWPAGWVKRESQKNQAANSRQRGLSLCLRGHTAPKGFATSKQRELRKEPPRRDRRSPNGSVRYSRRIGSLSPLFHVGKLISQGVDFVCPKPPGHVFQKRVPHPGTGTVRHQIAYTSSLASLKQSRDLFTVLNLNAHLLRYGNAGLALFCRRVSSLLFHSKSRIIWILNQSQRDVIVLPLGPFSHAVDDLSVFSRVRFSSYSNRELCRILLNYGALTPKSVHRPAWRSHPKLKTRLLGEHQDELLVMIHDGGPLLTKRRPEVVRVNVTGCEGDVFRGRVLHQPIQLHTIRLGQEIQFLIPDGDNNPVFVTEKYLHERHLWNIEPCRKCGFSELFDAPSDLLKLLLRNSPTLEKPTSFECPCPLCGGQQVLSAATAHSKPQDHSGK